MRREGECEPRFQQVFEENLAINLDPKKFVLFIYIHGYVCTHLVDAVQDVGFYVKIVKLGWYILWPCKMGEFEDGTCWTNRRSVLLGDFLKEH